MERDFSPPDMVRREAIGIPSENGFITALWQLPFSNVEKGPGDEVNHHYLRRSYRILTYG